MKRLLNASLLVPFTLLACDGQQYVSPDTVRLSVSDEDRELVSRCHFIPVLLGSQVKARYRVDEALRVTVTITRDEIEVSYDSGESELVATAELEDVPSGASLTLQNTPPGYSASLTPHCSEASE
jgi:hypothetical protein